MDKLIIIIPAYNEEANIEATLTQWHTMLATLIDGEMGCSSDSSIVLINDGSKDSTLNKAQLLAKTMPYLKVIDKPNSGHGASCYYGYTVALNKEQADYIFQTDSDGQTDPSEFLLFWQHRASYDMQIGYRHKREDGVSRIIVTKVLKWLLWLIFGKIMTDANTPFRLMKAGALKEELVFINSSCNLCNVFLTVAFTVHRRAIIYRPISFKPRQGGINSINIKKIIKIGQQAITDLTIFKKKLAQGITND